MDRQPCANSLAIFFLFFFKYLKTWFFFVYQNFFGSCFKTNPKPGKEAPLCVVPEKHVYGSCKTISHREKKESKNKKPLICVFFHFFCFFFLFFGITRSFLNHFLPFLGGG